MRTAALDVIRDEHQALAAMLRSLKMMLAQARREGHLPDFAVLRAMMFYVDEFPERLHHTKESAMLFPRLRERAPELAATLARLDNEHARGEAAVRDVEHALLAFEVMGESRREAFEQAVDRYVTAYLEHMAVEESQVLPVAQRVLTPADWAELDEAFAANRDPLTGHEPADEYRELFHTIVSNAPAPIGLGGGQGGGRGARR
jgi:hemerythrin-like domain-containing protein